jgi:hypothetical protein
MVAMETRPDPAAPGIDFRIQKVFRYPSPLVFQSYPARFNEFAYLLLVRFPYLDQDRFLAGPWDLLLTEPDLPDPLGRIVNSPSTAKSD